MYKNTKILLFLSFLLLVSILIFFPVCFDNNDDQIMFMMSSGVLSNKPTPEIIHINILIGYILECYFNNIQTFNGYSFLLEFIQIISFGTIFYLFLRIKNNFQFYKSLMLFFLLGGFSILCVVKLQFTVVSLFCAITALLVLQSNLSIRFRFGLAFIFILLSYLVRKDGFYIFSAFYFPIILYKLYKKENIKADIIFFTISIVLFNFLVGINTYQHKEMHKHQVALDIIADRPIQLNAEILNKFGFTFDDLQMINYRYPAATKYTEGETVVQLSKILKTNRTITEVKYVLIRFLKDERYIIFIYIISLIVTICLVKPIRLFVFMNLLMAIALILYLAITARIPHRVTFPILLYGFLINLYLLYQSDASVRIKKIFLYTLVLIGSYKFYCTTKMYSLQKNYHKTFMQYKEIINKNPDYLFINILDGIQLSYLNAWQKPNDLFPKKNIVFTGWNTNTEDFKQVLKFHNLKNINEDLRNRKNILFITNSKEFEVSFIRIMKEQYKIRCHLETTEIGENILPIKKLVFDI